MSFDPRYTDLSSLFNDNRLEIPPYQRNYVWHTQNVDKLLDDILECFHSQTQEDRSAEYFIGTVILVPSGSAEGPLDVVDGQQRLTTLFMLLGVLSTLVESDADFKEIYNEGGLRFSNARNDSSLQFFREFAEKPKSRLDALSRELADSKALKKALKDEKANTIGLPVGLALVNNWVNQNKSKFLPAKLFKFVARKVRFISIKASDYGKAVELFERINGDGVSLATGDLVKNLFLRIPEDSSATGMTAMCALWDKIEAYKTKPQLSTREIIGKKDGIDGFIQSACAVRVWPENYDGPTKSNLFKVIKAAATTGLQVTYAGEEDASGTRIKHSFIFNCSAEAFLDNIYAYAKSCAMLYEKGNPQYTSGEGGHYLKRLLKYKNSDWSGKLLLALPSDKEQLSLATREGFAQMVELMVLQVALNGSSKDMNKQVQKYFPALRKATDQTLLDIGATILRDTSLFKLPAEDVEKQLLTLRPAPVQKTDYAIAKHILLMLEEWLAATLDLQLPSEKEAKQCLSDLAEGVAEPSLGNLQLTFIKLKAPNRDSLLPGATQQMSAEQVGILGLPGLFTNQSPTLAGLAARTEAIASWFRRRLLAAQGGQAPFPVSYQQTMTTAETTTPHEYKAIPVIEKNPFEVGAFIELEMKGHGGKTTSELAEIVPGEYRARDKLGVEHPLTRFLMSAQPGAWYAYPPKAPPGKPIEEVKWLPAE